MSMDNFKLKGTDESVAARIAKRRGKGRPPWWIGLIALAGVLAVAAVWLAMGSDLEEAGNRAAVANTDGADSQEPGSKRSEKMAAETDSQAPTVEIVPDDGQLLWASPTSGPPISLDYIPPGTQLLLHVRPVDLAQHAEGEKVVAALGPWGEQASVLVEQVIGAAWTEVEELLVAVTPQVDGHLEFTWKATFAEPWSAEELARRFPAGTTEAHHGQAYLSADQRARFQPNGLAGKVLVVCPVGEVQSLIDSQGSAPPMPRDVQQLLSHVDSQQTCAVVFLNRFFQTSGYQLLTGSGEPLHDVLYKLFDGQVTAIALSVHWDQSFFWELRCTPTLSHRPHSYADQLRLRLRQLAGEAEDFVVALSSPSFGKKVVARFPGMLRVVSNYTRADVEDRHAVLRCYLPVAAGHNLLMASELLLNQPGSLDAAPEVPSQPQARTVAGRLERVTSLAFPKETLQRSLEMLSEDIGVDIQIAGGDLQLEGITKNQSLALDLRNRPASEILLEIVLRANPARTATGPDDPIQKLVYVIRPGKEGKSGAIVVTTRAAAESRGEKLPAVFISPE